MNHIMLHCEYSRELWSLVLCLFLMYNTMVYALLCGGLVGLFDGSVWQT